MKLKQELVRGMETYTRTFPAIRGIQAGREFYVTMMPLRMLASDVFAFVDNRLPPESRAQRILNKGRVPEIVRYVTNNPRDYTFSAITVSLDKLATFTPRLSFDKKGQVGDLTVPMDARFVVNDGQHRRAAIEQVIKLNDELSYETIPVVIFIDAGLKRSQQMFADLNKYSIRPTRSLGVLYDHTDPLAKMVRELIVKVELFTERVDKEATSISNRSKCLFTLSALYQANMSLLGKTKKHENVSVEESAFALEFWRSLQEIVPEWRKILKGEITAAEIRRDYINSSGVVLQALGLVGRAINIGHVNPRSKALSKLESIDWSKSNPCWEGRAMIGGRLSKTFTNMLLTCTYIKSVIGLELTPEERVAEQHHIKGMSVEVLA